MFKVFVLLVALSLADAKPVGSFELSEAKLSSNLTRPHHPDQLKHFDTGAALTFYRGSLCDGQKSKFRCDGTCNTLPKVYNSLQTAGFNNTYTLGLDYFSRAQCNNNDYIVSEDCDANTCCTIDSVKDAQFFSCYVTRPPVLTPLRAAYIR